MGQMDSKAIQKSIDALAKAMIAKGLREPIARFDIENDKTEFSIMLRWKDVTKAERIYSSDEYRWLKAASPSDVFKEAYEFVASLPSADEARLSQFMGALANVKVGRDNVQT